MIQVSSKDAVCYSIFTLILHLNHKLLDIVRGKNYNEISVYFKITLDIVTLPGITRGLTLKMVQWETAQDESPIDQSQKSKATPETTRKLKPGGHTCSQMTRKKAKKGSRRHKTLSVSTARSKKMPPKTSMSQCQESLRWVGAPADPVEEEERIEIYKANRRKRYLAAQLHLMKSLH